MRREWELEDLIASWTLIDADGPLLSGRHGATRLGFALLLKFFEIEGRFPRHAGEAPPPAVEYVARQVGVAPAEFAGYDWSGRQVKNHRADIRAALGFRECSAGDEDKLAEWLAEQVCPSELNVERQRDALLARCRAERLEPPGRTRVDRVLGAANRLADARFCATITGRLPATAVLGLEDLLTHGVLEASEASEAAEPDAGAELDAAAEDDGVGGAGDGASAAGRGAGARPGSGGRGFFAELKADPAPLGLDLETQNARPRAADQ